jgi:hypothetical protein
MANHRRSLAKESYWRRQLEGQAASGLSIRQYCRDQEFSEPSFYVWRRELAKRDKEIGSRSTRPAGLMAVDVIPSAGEVNLEIEVADGVVIRLREGASAETLARVLAVACAQGSDQVKSC